MLYQINLERILFIDIETVPATETYQEMPERLKALWDKKAGRLSPEVKPEDVYEQAGIYAEFGKIICISAGFFKDEGFRIKSFAGSDEPGLLSAFGQLLNTYYNHRESLLCGHNGKEFDFPYIARRMLINRIHLPEILNLAGKRPWEVAHLDTMELWKFGDYKHYTSLDLLAFSFGIPTPKDDMDGSMVAGVFYREKDIDRIVAYCQQDMITVAQVLLSYMGKPLIKEEQFIVSEPALFEKE
ncbi:MAG: 3'-5' exonuclease [Bacteroidales bacterium]|nr:3'-5' exonuclease [Bacteroidales bacterium]